MAKRLVHYIDHNGLQSYLAEGGRPKIQARFPTNDEGISAFSTWLERHLAGVHTLLVDLPDEGYQIELIPYVTKQDRSALVSRKLGQLFFGSPYSAALSLGRERTGRRDEQVLFTALTRPASVEPWLRALRQRGAAVSAAYSVPLLTRSLLASLKGAIDVSRGLLITFSHSGIRQIFFDGGELRFSRLSPAPEGPFTEWGAACLRETQKTWQYLTAQRWMPRTERLKTWVILDQADFAPVLAEIGESDNFVFHPVSLNSLALRAGLKEATTSSDSRTLMLHLAAGEPKSIQLAPPQDRWIFRLGQLRNVVALTGLLVGASLALWGLKFLIEANEFDQEAQQLIAQKNEREAQYKALLASLPAMPTSLESLQAVVARQDQLMATRKSPLDALAPLSHILDRYPDIEIHRIEWQQNSTSQTPPSAPGSPGPNQITTVVDAVLPVTAASDPRSSITRIREFAADVRRLTPNSDVALPRMPFDAEPDKTLRSDSATATRAPEFQLRWTTNKEPRP